MNHKINSHVHTTGSDGKLSPVETAKLAIEKGLHYICFTDHYPYPKGLDPWSESFHSEEYYKEVLKTIERFKDKIEISHGAEIGWVPSHKKWIENEIKKRKYDYILGSIHHIETANPPALNDSDEKFQELIKNYNGIRNLVKAYYNQVILMAKSGLFDCVAHLDLIKIYNKNSKYFNENESWYKNDVLKTLDEIQKSKMCIEINTSGFKKKCREQYPSFWILEEIKKRNIPITIGTDSHSPEDIDKDLEKAFAIAKELGFDKIMKFKDRKMIEINI